MAAFEVERLADAVEPLHLAPLAADGDRLALEPFGYRGDEPVPVAPSRRETEL